MKNRTSMRLAEAFRHCVRNDLGEQKSIEFMMEYAGVDYSTVDAYLQKKVNNEARIKAEQETQKKYLKKKKEGKKETTKKGKRVTMVKA